MRRAARREDGRRRPCGSRPSSTGSRSGPSPTAPSTVADLEAMVADTSEEVAWALSDAIVDRDPATPPAAAERLTDQGEAVTPMIYQAAKRLREAGAALELLEDGDRPAEVESALPMHPYAAKFLVRRVRTDRRPRSAPLPARSPTSSGGRAAAPTIRSASRSRWPFAAPRERDTRSGGRRRSLRRRFARLTRAARAFLRAPELRCNAPLRTAVSIFEHSSLCSASAAASSPSATAASSRRKWVFMALVMRRFSVRSRSERAFRFRCEAMLAIRRRRTIAGAA